MICSAEIGRKPALPTTASTVTGAVRSRETRQGIAPDPRTIFANVSDGIRDQRVLRRRRLRLHWPHARGSTGPLATGKVHFARMRMRVTTGSDRAILADITTRM